MKNFFFLVMLLLQTFTFVKAEVPVFSFYINLFDTSKLKISSKTETQTLNAENSYQFGVNFLIPAKYNFSYGFGLGFGSMYFKDNKDKNFKYNVNGFWFEPLIGYEVMPKLIVTTGAGFLFGESYYKPEDKNTKTKYFASITTAFKVTKYFGIFAKLQKQIGNTTNKTENYNFDTNYTKLQFGISLH